MNSVNSKNKENLSTELLRKSEQYENLFKHANDAILIFEPESEIVLEVNDKACEMYKRRREDFVGHSLKEMSKNVSRGTEELKKLLHDGIYEEFESVHLRGDGTPFNLIINAAVIEYEGKQAILTINRDVTARVKMEDELREREQHLLSVANSAQDAIVSADNRGRINFWNEGARKIFGYEESEVIGQSLTMLMPEKYREAHSKGMRRYTETGEARVIGQIVELEGLRKDGSVFPLELSLGVWDTANGKYFTGIMRDITERKQAEQSLLESESRYRLLGEGIMHQVWTAQPDGKIDYANRQTLDYFGKTLDEVFDGGWKIVIHPDDLPMSVERWKNSLETGDFFEAKFRLRAADDVYRWHLGRATAGRDAEGNIIKWFGTNTDIHDQTIAEEVLSESEDRFRLLVEGVQDYAIFMLDPEGYIVSWNAGAERVKQYRAEEIIGSHFSRFYTPEDRARNHPQNEMKIAAAEGHYEEEGWRIRKDGTRFLANVLITALKDENGQLRGFSKITRDITERKRSEDALRESEYKLRTLLTSMSEGLLQVDNEERIEFVNDRFCEMLGYEESELLGKHTFDVMFNDDGRKFINNINRQRQKGISSQYELSLKKRTGEMIYVIVGGAPVINAEGEVIGSMGIYTDITERKRAEEQLLHDAFHDGLTGLANRALFMDHLQRTIERGKSRNGNFYAVLFLDFDRFKVINDSLGHSEGDNFLKMVARRLEHSTRAGDLVARLGGDEFVVLLSEMPEANDALVIAERIQEDLKKSFELGGREIFISASIGIALSTDGHQRAEDMLRDADIAMYHAKSKGRAQYQVFDSKMHEQASKQLSLETEMRHALEREEFEVHYQPIIDLENESLIGFESLVRWRHPTRGMIPPFEFISAAEENNLILPLGKWILLESCRQLREWQIANPSAVNLTVSVNLSSKQFSQPDLAEQVAEALKKSKLDSRCLKLEITESHVMENSEQAIAVINRLRELGVELSLDDFGTGYSSLSYLHRLPASFLKIDRSFVTRMMENEENGEIVSTIIKLAQSLKMKVIAEGIETAEQLARLKNLNCEFGQGYFFSKPLEASAAKKFIENHLETSPVFIEQSFVDNQLNM